ncbi:hypothetical protein HYU91_00305 [Candidatus Collierbacteria bacterium]|nr:hypothetical protein [Candidatus Collierbacteria bacterium]
MAQRNTSDRRCANGKGNFQVDGLGDFEELVAAETAEKQHPATKLLRSENRQAVRQGVKIRLGLPA